MLIKLFIVTYNAPEKLKATLTTLFHRSDIKNHNVQVFIINNHSKFHLDKEFADKTTVLHNDLRPDFSTGHLSRNWNQALILGFENLKTPACDYVICAQEDTVFLGSTFTDTSHHHTKFDFIQNGRGDNYMSWNVEGVRNIGMWDERFCNIGYQEADYALRAYLWHKEKSSINDEWHGLILNPIKAKLVQHPSGNNAGASDHHQKSQMYHRTSCLIFNKKWNIEPFFWKDNVLNKLEYKPKIESYLLYPYFSKDIYNLKEKGYLV